jgi:hypothetical protein
MSDIVERLRQISKSISAWDLSDLTMRIPAEPDRDADLVVMRAADTIEALRRERNELNHEFGCEHRLYLTCKHDLAAMTAERDKWKHEAGVDNARWNTEQARLAASQAREQQLRDALNKIRNDDIMYVSIAREAYFLPHDDTCLRQAKAKVLRDAAEKLSLAACMDRQMLIRMADELLEGKK